MVYRGLGGGGLHRWLGCGAQVVRGWYTGGLTVVHRWLEDGIQMVRG